MATIHRAQQWSRWAGHLSDIERAARTTAALLQDWTGRASPIRVIATLTGRVVEAESWETFEGLVDIRDLQLLKGLKIDIGEILGPRASIHFENKSPALSIEVVGDDRSRVEGVFVEITHALSRGSQLPQGLVTFAAAISIVAVIVLSLRVVRHLGVLTVTEVGSDTVLGTDPASLLSMGALAGIVVLSFIFVALLFPTLEILQEGRAPALVRLRIWILAAVGAVAASLVASYIYGSVNP
jgi:hypothetical protein